MSTPPPRSPKTKLSRQSLSFITLGVIVVGVIAATESPVLGIVVLVVLVVVAGVAWRRLRPTSGSGIGIFSTNCEQCGALLRGTMGLPARTCSECGHRQSWAP